MSPELIEFFEDFPPLIFFLALASPFFLLLGVIITGIIQRKRDKGQQQVAEGGVSVSEKEADTHQFQAIIEGFEKSLKVVSDRATSAEAKADAAEEKADILSHRVRSLEDERHQAMTHLLLLEALIPYPPGPPERPLWMRQLVKPLSEAPEKGWAPERDPPGQ